MKKILSVFPWVLIFSMAGCATQVPSPPLETASKMAETQPPEPMESVMTMAERLASADRFRVTLHMGYDVLQNSGEKIVFRERRSLLVDRPHGLRVETLQSDGDEILMVFDGKSMTLYDSLENVYAPIDYSGDLDEMVRFAVNDLGIRVPLAWMLLRSLPQDLKRLTKQVVYVELDVLDNPATHHIAGRTGKVDYQFWIGPDHLPRRIFLTYVNEPGQPQFWAEFSDWNLKPKVEEASFVFSPPTGAEQVPFVIPEKGAVETRPQARAQMKKRARDDEF